MNCASPLKLYPKTELFRIDPEAYRIKYPLGYMEVPCGKCLSCRIARSREWSLRLMHESAYWDHSTFVTLTYSDEHLPKNLSINKADLQKFFKRIRKAGHKIRYYACGEYGERYGRCHYHAIIFGLRCDHDFQQYWPFGIVHTGTVTYDSCRYVAQYIDKKYYGEKADEIYTSRGLAVPFQICSQKLGLQYALSDQERIKENLYITSRGVKVGVPRYYKKKLQIDSARYASRSIEKFIEIYRHYDEMGCSLDEANEKIAQARRQNDKSLSARASIARSRKIKLTNLL